MRTAFDLLKATFNDWNEDKAPRLAAALAYYTIFSLAPLLVIIIAVASLIYSTSTVETAVLNQVGSLVGSAGEEMISSAIESANQPQASILATIIGIATLILGATGVFVQLQDGLNTVWEVAPKPDRGILSTLRDRLVSFSMVLVVGFLLLVSLAVSAGLQIVNEYLSSSLPGGDVLWQVINIVISLLVITLLFATIFKFLPDVEITWGDVWIGAFVTAVLFTIGKFLIGLYLGRGSVGSTYGAAGSLATLLVWIYYSGLIFYFGAEFTQVYARRYGSRIVPSDNAVSLTASDRVTQGIPRREQVEAASEAQEAPTGAAPQQPAEHPPRSTAPAGLAALIGFIIGRRAAAKRNLQR